MITAGLAASVLVYLVLNTREEVHQIATAAFDLPARATLEEGAFQYSSIAVADPELLAALLVPADVARAIEEGWSTSRPIPGGDPLRRSDFRVGTGLSGVRAMSIPIERGHAVGGDLRVGDLVDVVVVRKGVAGYVATGAEVLSVSGGQDQFTGSFNVTIAIDAAGSLRLASALRDGSIELVRATGAPAAQLTDTFDPLRDSEAVGTESGAISREGTG